MEESRKVQSADHRHVCGLCWFDFLVVLVGQNTSTTPTSGNTAPRVPLRAWVTARTLCVSPLSPLSHKIALFLAFLTCQSHLNLCAQHVFLTSLPLSYRTREFVSLNLSMIKHIWISFALASSLYVCVFFVLDRVGVLGLSPQKWYDEQRKKNTVEFSRISQSPVRMVQSLGPVGFHKTTIEMPKISRWWCGSCVTR